MNPTPIEEQRRQYIATLTSYLSLNTKTEWRSLHDIMGGAGKIGKVTGPRLGLEYWFRRRIEHDILTVKCDRWPQVISDDLRWILVVTSPLVSGDTNVRRAEIFGRRIIRELLPKYTGMYERAEKIMAGMKSSDT